MTKKIKVKTQDDKQTTESPAPQEHEQPEEKPDELEALKSELEETKAKAAEYLDGWQRAQAEFSNYKKRQEAERTQMMAQANMTVLRKVIPIVDDFERATRTMPKDLKQVSWCEGIALIKAKLDTMLDSEGVTPIETQGKTFDPVYHEAVTYEEVAGYSEGQIIGEVQKGYMLGERVLRPALVRVAKNSSPAEKNDQIVEIKGE